MYLFIDLLCVYSLIYCDILHHYYYLSTKDNTELSCSMHMKVLIAISITCRGY